MRLNMQEKNKEVNKEVKEEIKTDANIKKNKMKVRRILVFAFIIIVTIFAFVSYRGNYLETIEIGENFKQVFTQDLKYQYITIAVNFIILFITISIANNGIKKGLKDFFDEEKKVMPKLPNKSIAFILAMIVSIIASNCFIY